MGTLMKNGIPYGGGGGGDNSRIINYEDYLNLSEAEKKNGTTYYVPDYPTTADLRENLIKYTSETISISTSAKTVADVNGTALPPSSDYICVSAQVGYIGGMSKILASVVVLPTESNNYGYKVAMYDEGSHTVATTITFTWVKIA